MQRAVVNEYNYDSYGNAELATEGVAQPFRYTGREYDAETGLFYYRARMYDPKTGRFLQADPLWFDAGDLNVYRYTWNNPVNWTDPSGFSSIAEDNGLRAIALGAVRAISGAGLSIKSLVDSAAIRFGLDGIGRRYYLQAAARNLTKIANGTATLGDLFGERLAGVGATIHQANKAADDDAAGAGSGNGGGAGAGGADPGDGDDDSKRPLNPWEVAEKFRSKGYERIRDGKKTRSGVPKNWVNPKTGRKYSIDDIPNYEGFNHIDVRRLDNFKLLEKRRIPF